MVYHLYRQPLSPVLVRQCLMVMFWPMWCCAWGL